MKTAAIHQPNFLPWLGYFYKMLKSDCFVFLDDVQYIRRGYTNRVKVKNQNGETWLTIPVQKKGRYDQLITEVEIRPDDQWKGKITGTLQACYGKAPHFYAYFPGIASIIHEEYTHLAELNIQLIQWIAVQLDIRTPMFRSSRLKNISGASTQRLASICRGVEASRYLSGFGGQKYQEEEIFNSYQIELVVYDFQHPQYPQMFGEFLPGLSILDLIFNCGPDSPQILRAVNG